MSVSNFKLIQDPEFHFLQKHFDEKNPPPLPPSTYMCSYMCMHALERVCVCACDSVECTMDRLIKVMTGR